MNQFSHQNQHRSNRSNAYSESKCSNWMEFDPQNSDFWNGFFKSIFSKQKPTSTIRISEDVKIKYYETPLHDEFIRPCSLEDIVETLQTVPERFLKSLCGIYSPGGTRKQAQVAYSRKFRYGAYCRGFITLFPFPKKLLKQYFPSPPAPHIQHEYYRSHVKTYQQGNSWVVEFDEAALRTFYLKDVLLHEIGHHLDWLRRKKMEKLTEEFAQWFASEYGFKKDDEKSTQRAN